MADLDQGLGKRFPVRDLPSFDDFPTFDAFPALDRVHAIDLRDRILPRGGTSVRMVRLVRKEILPRLLARRPAFLPPAPSELVSPDDAPFDAARIIAFADILLAPDRRDPAVHLEALLAQGVGLDTLLVDLLAPTATYLGTLWDLDECSFSDVTLGLCTLHRLVRDFGRRHGGVPDIEPDRRVLLAPVPGNQHTFGLAMVETLFRRAGWTALAMPASSAREIVAATRDKWFAIVGLAASCDDAAPGIADLIASIRRASLNPSLVVLVGGRFFTDHPEQALRMGADATAADARRAIADSACYLDAARAGRPRRASPLHRMP